MPIFYTLSDAQNILAQDLRNGHLGSDGTVATPRAYKERGAVMQEPLGSHLRRVHSVTERLCASGKPA